MQASAELCQAAGPMALPGGAVQARLEEVQREAKAANEQTRGKLKDNQAEFDAALKHHRQEAIGLSIRGARRTCVHVGRSVAPP